MDGVTCYLGTHADIFTAAADLPGSGRIAHGTVMTNHHPRDPRVFTDEHGRRWSVERRVIGAPTGSEQLTMPHLLFVADTEGDRGILKMSFGNLPTRKELTKMPEADLRKLLKDAVGPGL